MDRMSSICEDNQDCINILLHESFSFSQSARLQVPVSKQFPWDLSWLPLLKEEQGTAVVLQKFGFNLLPHSLVSKLLVEGKFDSFNVMAKFNGWAKLQVHALLNSRKSKQEKCLPIYFLIKKYSG